MILGPVLFFFALEFGWRAISAVRRGWYPSFLPSPDSELERSLPGYMPPGTYRRRNPVRFWLRVVKDVALTVVGVTWGVKEILGAPAWFS